MPKRPRSHQLEDISIQQFEGLLPAAWVSRRKDKDYGVDLEVEVFDANGQSTGLMFFVQLKATDNAEKARSTSVKVDRLNYLASLDVPSMLVRYCEPSRTLHWIWLTEIFARMPPPDTESVTVKFEASDLWAEETPKAILRTLHVYRTMRIGSRQTPIGLEIHSESAHPDSAFALQYAVGRIFDFGKRFTKCFDPTKCLPLRVGLDGDVLCVEIDTIASIQVVLRSTHREEVFVQLIYIIAYMVGRADFDDQLYELATIIHQGGLKCQSRVLASEVAAAVVEKPDLAAAIASINALHDRQDGAYRRYIQSLLDHSVSLEEKATGIDLFYREAIAAHQEQPEEVQATIHYSYANSLRVAFDLPSAISQFNLARKKSPEYLERAYFLKELGATLYFLRRFRLSSKVYAAAYEKEANPNAAICAGDAYLFSGDTNRAKNFYQIATESKNHFEASEGGLKLFLANWMEEFRLNSGELVTDLLSQAGFWSDVMQQGIDEDRYDQALSATLLLSFCLEDNPAAWADAIQIAVRDGDASFIASTLSCAIGRCGYEAYSLFRDILIQQDFPHEYVQTLDKIADDLNNSRSPKALKNPTIMRLIDPVALDLVIDAPVEDRHEAE